MTPETRTKITKGIKTTEFIVVLLMSVLTSAMVILQDHSDTVLPVELQMKILATLGVVYVFCRTALKLVGLVAYFLKLDRGESLPVPLPPPGVTLPKVGMPLTAVATAAAPLVPWTDLRAADIAREEAEAKRTANLFDPLGAFGQQNPVPPPVVLRSEPEPISSQAREVRGH